jgi:hypothetical protein
MVSALAMSRLPSGTVRMSTRVFSSALLACPLLCVVVGGGGGGLRVSGDADSARFVGGLPT